MNRFLALYELGRTDEAAAALDAYAEPAVKPPPAVARLVAARPAGDAPHPGR